MARRDFSLEFGATVRKEREAKRVESLDKVSPVLLDPQPRRKAPE